MIRRSLTKRPVVTIAWADSSNRTEHRDVQVTYVRDGMFCVKQTDGTIWRYPMSRIQSVQESKP